MIIRWSTTFSVGYTHSYIFCIKGNCENMLANIYFKHTRTTWYNRSWQAFESMMTSWLCSYWHLQRSLSDADAFFFNQIGSLGIWSFRYLAWMCTTMLAKNGGVRIRFLLWIFFTIEFHFAKLYKYWIFNFFFPKRFNYGTMKLDSQEYRGTFRCV